MGIYEKQTELKEKMSLEGRRERARREGRSLVKEHTRKTRKIKEEEPSNLDD